MMKALCAIKKEEYACSLHKSMIRHGCVRDSVIFQTSIHAPHKENRSTEPLRLLEEMIVGIVLQMSQHTMMLFITLVRKRELDRDGQ